ncbi:MAG: ABC-ATPase domain-containing protein [Lachnospiraceae bacterium]|nr:ABC-ATPase domain-containing protein [Lachnospiraceae bacterium]
MKTQGGSSGELRAQLERIDHRGYPAYKDLRGNYQFSDYTLSIDHVQGDPFASPSRVTVVIEGAKAGFPQELYDTKWKRIALQDELLRTMGGQLERYSFQVKGSGKSGLIAVSRCGQEILERSGCQMDSKTGTIVCRMEIGFPANGRTIQAQGLEKILFEFLPRCVKQAFYYASLDGKKLQKISELANQQQFIREELKRRKLAAFVANGSILPRETGISSRPMKQAIPFVSPKTLEVTMELPHGKVISGMGIPLGVTLIVGGGYHGKSTLLKALETGIYNHIAGDGREYVITDASAMKIRAEDGRSIDQVNISLFIKDLPNKKDTVSFSTQDASGSTSQAAGVMESIEAGSRVLLMDEDTSATNFMIRDELMQRVVQKEAEPITPFVDRIRPLYEQGGISTILVAGSSGSYFAKADVILQMKNYEPVDITEFAQKEAEKFGLQKNETPESSEIGIADFIRQERILHPRKGFDKTDRVKTRTSGKDGISVNHDEIDLRYVEQLVDHEQMNTLASLYVYAQRQLADGKMTLKEAVTRLQEKLEQQSFSFLDQEAAPNLAMPRKQEIYAMFNRAR